MDGTTRRKYEIRLGAHASHDSLSGIDHRVDDCCRELSLGSSAEKALRVRHDNPPLGRVSYPAANLLNLGSGSLLSQVSGKLDVALAFFPLGFLLSLLAHDSELGLVESLDLGFQILDSRLKRFCESNQLCFRLLLGVLKRFELSFEAFVEAVYVGPKLITNRSRAVVGSLAFKLCDFACPGQILGSYLGQTLRRGVPKNKSIRFLHSAIPL